MPILRGPRVVLRSLQREDRDRLRAIMAEPTVAPWFGFGGPDVAVDSWLDADQWTRQLAILVDGAVVGSIQYSEEQDPDYPHASIDLFLDTAHQGRGFGTEAIRVVARHLFEERGHHRLIIDPSAANERAIRAYTSVGFRPVGVMRRYERGPDGTFHDGLLMDMLADELIDAGPA
ncbi:MAG: GNAT family protein [Chloroflexota bacterium]